MSTLNIESVGGGICLTSGEYSVG